MEISCINICDNCKIKFDTTYTSIKNSVSAKRNRWPHSHQLCKTVSSLTSSAVWKTGSMLKAWHTESSQQLSCVLKDGSFSQRKHVLLSVSTQKSLVSKDSRPSIRHKPSLLLPFPSSIPRQSQVGKLGTKPDRDEGTGTARKPLWDKRVMWSPAGFRLNLCHQSSLSPEQCMPVSASHGSECSYKENEILCLPIPHAWVKLMTSKKPDCWGCLSERQDSVSSQCAMGSTVLT